MKVWMRETWLLRRTGRRPLQIVGELTWASWRDRPEDEGRDLVEVYEATGGRWVLHGADAAGDRGAEWCHWVIWDDSREALVERMETRPCQTAKWKAWTSDVAAALQVSEPLDPEVKEGQ